MAILCFWGKVYGKWSINALCMNNYHELCSFKSWFGGLGIRSTMLLQNHKLFSFSPLAGCQNPRRGVMSSLLVSYLKVSTIISNFVAPSWIWCVQSDLGFKIVFEKSSFFLHLFNYLVSYFAILFMYHVKYFTCLKIYRLHKSIQRWLLFLIKPRISVLLDLITHYLCYNNLSGPGLSRIKFK